MRIPLPALSPVLRTEPVQLVPREAELALDPHMIDSQTHAILAQPSSVEGGTQILSCARQIKNFFVHISMNERGRFAAVGHRWDGKGVTSKQIPVGALLRWTIPFPRSPVTVYMWSYQKKKRPVSGNTVCAGSEGAGTQGYRKGWNPFSFLYGN
jgi:hypothetical protein